VNTQFLLLMSAAACAIAAVSVPLCRRTAERSGLVAHPADDRWHRRAVPKLGGAAVLFGFLGSLPIGGAAAYVWPIAMLALLMFAVGLADDVRAMPPATKLILQTLASAAFIYFTPIVQITGVPVVDTLLALFWIVGLTNAFNLLDNMDGLAAGTAALAALALVLLLQSSGAPQATALTGAAAAFAGAMVGFLFYNFPPASIFMGDSGSHMLGGVLAGTTLLATAHVDTGVHVSVVPVLLLLIPIVDTTFVTIARGMAGRSAFMGGRDHLSHRLVALGVSERRAVVLLYGLAATGGAVALGLTRGGESWAAPVAVLYLVVLAGVSLYLGQIEVTYTDDRPLARDVAYMRRAYEAAMDLVLIAVAYYLAFAIRFQNGEFQHFLPYFVKSLPVVMVCQIAALWAVGKYRRLEYALSATEVMTILRGIVVGVGLSILAVVFLYRLEGFSRAVFGFNVVTLSFLLVGARVAISLADEYLRTRNSRGRNVLIYGAGRGGRLLARELLQNPDLELVPVGFLDDDPEKQRLRVEGIRVVGRMTDLPRIAAALDAGEVAIGIRDLTTDRFLEIATICHEHGLQLRRMRFSLEDVRVVPDRSVLRFPTGHG
jgi:UDP-GlcNAc:undecaprenyl-phosphate GlcNAc-1-phosphate transferase